MDQIISMYDIIEREAKSGPYRVFVDIGVRQGCSSRALCKAASFNDGKIYGIDFGYCRVAPPDNVKNYKFIEGESVTVGKNWQYERPDFVFIDATHVKEWVMCELYFWWDLLSVGGVVGFHDTNWEPGRRDIWCGVEYDTVKSAILEFFGLENFQHGSENVSINHYDSFEGLTFVRKRNDFDFKSRIGNWNQIFEVRRQIIGCVIKQGHLASEYCDGDGKISKEWIDLDPLEIRPAA